MLSVVTAPDPKKVLHLYVQTARDAMLWKLYGLSDYDDAWILSIDGRGDYETATSSRPSSNRLGGEHD